MRINYACVEHMNAWLRIPCRGIPRIDDTLESDRCIQSKNV